MRPDRKKRYAARAYKDLYDYLGCKRFTNTNLPAHYIFGSPQGSDVRGKGLAWVWTMGKDDD